MTVHIDISNRQKMTHFLELLKSMDFVERVRVEETPQALSQPVPAQSSFYDQFKGSLPNVDIADFERYLTETRNEWERDIS